MVICAFAVSGTPISVQGRGPSKIRWKGLVSTAARAALPNSHAPAIEPLRATVGYFYPETDLDLDNILKPILDSLNGLVYVDDKQVMDLVAYKRDLAAINTLTAVSPELILALQSHISPPSDFVFVQIETTSPQGIP